MASLVLDNIPQHLLDRLQQEALSHKTSIEEQALRLLESALEPSSFTKDLAQWQQDHPEPFDEDAHTFDDVRAHDLGREVEL